jgi:hypothetical protein
MEVIWIMEGNLQNKQMILLENSGSANLHGGWYGSNGARKGAEEERRCSWQLNTDNE